MPVIVRQLLSGESELLRRLWRLASLQHEEQEIATNKRFYCRETLNRDTSQFVAMAFYYLHHLHEGNVASYRLRLSEYRSWKQSLRGATLSG